MGVIKKLLLPVFLFCALPSAAQQIDPTLAFAVEEQTRQLKDEYKKRRSLQQTIATCQFAVSTAMDEVHRLERRVLKYMGNASAALQNMYQLKQIGELVALDIPKNLVALGKDIPDNLKGTGISLVVNRTIQDTTEDIVALSSIIERLVTAHYYFDEDTNGDDKNINLLSAAERFAILTDVHRRLNAINRRIIMMKYFIKTYSWKHLWMGLDRESWCNVVYGKMLTNQIIKQWDKILHD